MDPYDSDSSVDEDFTETNVLLGYADEEVIEDTISHLGGWPSWIDENTPPPGEFANCKVCNSPMLLLLELHGDLPDHFPNNERRLYIFGCPRKPCNRKPGSIRAYRATRKVRISLPAPSSASGTATKQTPESTGVQAPWPAQSAFPPPYKKYFLDAEYETMSRPSTPTVPENVTIEPMEEDGAGAEGNAELKDTFESEMDKAFMKFSMRLAHNPEQVLRYEYRGTPLLSSYTDQVGKRLHPEHSAGRVTTTGGGSMPPCEYCGAPRVFEVQLVPHAISMLEDGREGVGLGEGDAGWSGGPSFWGFAGRTVHRRRLGSLAGARNGLVCSGRRRNRVRWTGYRV